VGAEEAKNQGTEYRRDREALVTAQETRAEPSPRPKTGVSPDEADIDTSPDELMRTRFMLDWDEYQEGSNRRRFLYISAIATSLAGATFFVWPFLQSMNPAADVEATATTEVDLSKIKPGESITVVWRGKPVFIRHRTAEEIAAARRDDSAALPDPQPDSARVERPEWLVVIGICNHLGCVPRGQRPTDPKGEYGGWFCPCHGSQFDTSGRVRNGPAPSNLTVPEYAFVSDSMIRIG
jgi:ubiquinol-cytochrome c reductase iron-sulfur subunit